MALARHRNGKMLHGPSGKAATSCLSCTECQANFQATPSAYSVVVSGVTVCGGFPAIPINGTWVVPLIANPPVAGQCVSCLSTGTVVSGANTWEGRIYIKPIYTGIGPLLIVAVPDGTAFCDIPVGSHTYFSGIGAGSSGTGQWCDDPWTLNNLQTSCLFGTPGFGGSAAATPIL